MTRVKTTLLLCLLIALPTLAHASVVWEDANAPSTVYTGDASSYYTVGPDVLATLAPGAYTFSLDYRTLGTWDSGSAYADYLVATADVSENTFRTVASSMVGEGLYNLSLDFLVDTDQSYLANLPSYVLRLIPFIGVFSDVTGVDEQWQVVAAKITSPTPIPGAALLLASGLFALVGIKRRSRIA